MIIVVSFGDHLDRLEIRRRSNLGNAHRHIRVAIVRIRERADVPHPQPDATEGVQPFENLGTAGIAALVRVKVPAPAPRCHPLRLVERAHALGGKRFRILAARAKHRIGVEKGNGILGVIAFGVGKFELNAVRRARDRARFDRKR